MDNFRQNSQNPSVYKSLGANLSSNQHGRALSNPLEKEIQNAGFAQASQEQTKVVSQKKIKISGISEQNKMNPKSISHTKTDVLSGINQKSNFASPFRSSGLEMRDSINQRLCPSQMSPEQARRVTRMSIKQNPQKTTTKAKQGALLKAGSIYFEGDHPSQRGSQMNNKANLDPTSNNNVEDLTSGAGAESTRREMMEKDPYAYALDTVQDQQSEYREDNRMKILQSIRKKKAYVALYKIDSALTSRPEDQVSLIKQKSGTNKEDKPKLTEITPPFPIKEVPDGSFVSYEKSSSRRTVNNPHNFNNFLDNGIIGNVYGSVLWLVNTAQGSSNQMRRGKERLLRFKLPQLKV